MKRRHFGSILTGLVVLIAIIGLVSSEGQSVFSASTKTIQPGKVFDTSNLRTFKEQCAHPECTAFAGEKLFSALTRLRHLQFIGNNHESVIMPELLDILENIIDRNPRWYEPYELAQLLGPIEKSAPVAYLDQLHSRNQTIELGEKGMKNICDREQIQTISGLNIEAYNDLFLPENIWERKNLSNSCSTYKLPYFLAFNYYSHMRNEQKAIKYFKIAALHDDAPAAAQHMPAIVAGRLGNHQKSSLIRFNKYQQSIEEGATGNTRFLHKALMEYSLSLLAKLDTKEIDKPALAAIINNEISSCKADPGTVPCYLLDYGLTNDYISSNGNMVYPIDPEKFVYGRDHDLEDWRIKPRQ